MLLREVAALPAEAWKFVKPADLAGRTADASAVEGLVHSLNTLRATKLATEKAEPEVLDREFGLKTPATKAIITVTKDGTMTKIKVSPGTEPYGQENAATFTVSAPSTAAPPDRG